MAKETVASLKAEISRLETEVGRQRTLASQWQNEKVIAEGALKDSRGHFAELKEKLADAEANVARMAGYIERVREDDNARDGFDVVDQTRETIVPRRNPDRSVSASRLPANDGGLNFAGARRPVRHWTDY